MRKATLLALAFAALASATKAQSPFDGTWKLERAAAPPSDFKFDISLKAGVYGCRSCRPAWEVPADGAFHGVAGHDEFDETSVQVIDNRTVIFTRRKHGRTVYQAIDVLSADSGFLSFSWTERGSTGAAISGDGIWTRLTPVPASAHAITGVWRELRANRMSDNASTFSIRTEGDELHMAFGTGESLKATFGGAPSQVEGAPKGILISLRRLGDAAFEETETHDGEVAIVRTSTLIDPSTLKIVSLNKRTGKSSLETAHKQRR